MYGIKCRELKKKINDYHHIDEEVEIEINSLQLLIVLLVATLSLLFFLKGGEISKMKIPTSSGNKWQ